MQSVKKPDQTSPEALSRDQDYIKKIMPWAMLVSKYYFQYEVFGLQNLTSQQAIYVCNHSGGLSTPDTIVVANIVWHQLGPNHEIYALVHESAFRKPKMASHLNRVGGLPANSKSAVKALAAGSSLVIYPGAGHDAYRPWHERNLIKLGDKDSYVRLAMKYQVPIIPVVCHGGHETLVCLDDGERATQSLGLEEYGIERLPLTWSMPWGISVGVRYTIPLPKKIRVSFGEPIVFGVPWNSTVDKDAMRAVHLHIQSIMQRSLDQLVRIDADPPLPSMVL